MNSLRRERAFSPVVDNAVYNCEVAVIATNVPVCHDRPLLDTAKDLICAFCNDFSVAHILRM